MKIEEIVITIVAISYLPVILEGAFISLRIIFVQDYNPLDTDFSNWLIKAVIPWWLKPFELISRLPSVLVAIGLTVLARIIKISQERGL